MTITYDPSHPKYWDDSDLRDELTRVYDLCHGCRVCFNLCTSFPTLFSFVDRHDDQDAAKLTRAEQDQVVDECFQCKKCYVVCPYTPDQGHDWQLDFPRLMLRALAVRKKDTRRSLTDHMLGRTDLLGKLGTAAAPVANAMTGSPGSFPRKMMERVVGIAAQRVLPPYARQRFTTWFKKRPITLLERPQSTVSVFPTCIVEYQNPSIGKDLVKVYERNGVSCSLPAGVGCCGAPWLHSGDFDAFRAQARKNIASLVQAVKSGRDIVVPQPTCGYVLKKDYPAYFASEPEAADAAVIGANTYDAVEYLWRLHKGEGTSFDTDFSAGHVPSSTSYHLSCHLQAQNIGLKSRDVMKLTGTKVAVVNKCSGIDGTWGYRKDNYAIAKRVSKSLADALASNPSDVVTGDCHLANGAIVEDTGRKPMHPLQFMARAYGIPNE